MKYLEEYLKYLKYEKNYSQETIDSYEEDLVEFEAFWEEAVANVEEEEGFLTEEAVVLVALVGLALADVDTLTELFLDEEEIVETFRVEWEAFGWSSE